MPPETDAAPAKATEKPKDAGAHIVKNTTIVSAFLLVGRIVGPARELIVSRLIGTTGISDVFRFAYEGILQDVYTKFEKLLQPIYIPIFVARQRADGDKAAWKFTSVVGTLQGLGLITVALLGTIYAPNIAGWITKSHAEKIGPGTIEFDRLVWFLSIFFPALVVYSLSNLAELTLQSYHQFTIPALAEALRRVSIVGGVVAAIVIFHVPSEHQTTYALALGALVGIGLRLCVQLPSLWQRLKLFRPSLDLKNPDVRKAIVLAIPLVVGILFALARNLAEAKFAFEQGVGAYSGLKYARRIVDTPWQILALALSYVIFPFISELSASKEKQRLADALVSTARVIAFFFVPLSVFFLIVGESTVRVAFFGLKFDEQSVAITMSALPWYLIGMFFFALEDPLLKWFYALSDTKTPIAMGIVGDLIWLTVAAVGVKVYNLGLPAIAAAMSVSKTLKVLVLLAILRPRLGRIGYERVVPFVGKLALATALMALATRFVSEAIKGALPAELLAGVKGHVLVLFPAFAAALAVFLILSLALRIEECWLVADRLKAKLLRRR